MANHTTSYSDAKQETLSVFFMRLMRAVRAGAMTPDDAREDVMQCIAAMSKGDYDTPINHALDPADRIKALAGRA